MHLVLSLSFQGMARRETLGTSLTKMVYLTVVLSHFSTGEHAGTLDSFKC